MCPQPQPLSPEPLPGLPEWTVRGGLPGFSLILSVSPGRPRIGQWIPQLQMGSGARGALCLSQEALEVCH